MSTQLSTHERLEFFAARANELRELRLVRDGMRSKFSLSWNVISKQLAYRAIQPDEEDLRSFLLLFRQFISDREPIFINRIFNDCLRFLDSSELKEQLTKAKDEWKRLFQGMGAIQMVVDNRKLTGEYVLDLWINGHYFHSDSDKAVELHRLMTDQIPLVRMQFMDVLPRLTEIIVYTANVVTYGLREGLFRVPDDTV
jgi:hypothetical protein